MAILKIENYNRLGMIYLTFMVALTPIALVLLFNFPDFVLLISVAPVIFAAILAVLVEKFIIPKYSQNEKVRKTAFYLSFLAYLCFIFLGEKIFIAIKGLFEPLLQTAPFFSESPEVALTFAELCAFFYLAILAMAGIYYLLWIEQKRFLGIISPQFKWNLPENASLFVRKHKKAFGAALLIFFAIYFLNLGPIVDGIIGFQYSLMYSGKPGSLGQLLVRYFPIMVTTMIVIFYPPLLLALLSVNALKVTPQQDEAWRRAQKK
jgi:hypothetical protein